MTRADISKSVKRKNSFLQRIKELFLPVVLIILIPMAFAPLQAEEAGLSKVIFFVD